MTYTLDDDNEEDRDFLRELLDFVSDYPDKDTAIICMESLRASMAIKAGIVSKDDAIWRLADLAEMFGKYLAGYTDKVNFRLERLERAVGLSYAHESGAPLFPESHRGRQWPFHTVSVLERLEKIDEALKNN